MRYVGRHLSFLFGGIGSGIAITERKKVNDLMKATINGIAVEGTPQEIMEFQRLQNEKMGIKPFQPFSDQFKYQTMITSIGTGATKKNSCPNNGLACYCTGACKN